MHSIYYYVNKVLLMMPMCVLMTSAVNYVIDECWRLSLSPVLMLKADILNITYDY